MITQDKFEGGVQVNKVGDVWLEVLEVNGVALSTPAYIAEIHMGTRYATITQLSTPTPPDPTPSPVTLKSWQITVDIDGVEHTFNG